MRKEEWRSIRGFAGRYEVSSLGRVRSLRRVAGTYDIQRKTPLVMKAQIHGVGYLAVTLGYGREKKQEYIHRLVGTAFHGACPSGKQCAHLDGDRKNNHASNLRWVTAKENSSHRFLHGTHLIGTSSPRSKLNERQVLEIRRTYPFDRRLGAFAKLYGVSKQVVQNVINRKTYRNIA